MNRRHFLTLTGTAIGASTVVGTASASHVEDPYANEYIAAHPGNYNNASRSAAAIDWIVIHVGEGSYSSIVNWFQNPNANVSAHYVVRNSDGYAAQMVHHEDIAWHAGGQNYNEYSIGLEHGGYTGETEFTEALYQKSANIVSWVCDQYDIPKHHPAGVAPCDPSADGGIIGHHQVPEADCGPNNHTDPGSTWDWDHYMALVGGTNEGNDGENNKTDYNWPVFSRGERSTDIYAVQFLLEQHGYNLQYHDGIYGPETEGQVENFQSDHGLSVDGIVGPNTWRALIVPVYEYEGTDPYWATYAVQHNLRHDHGYTIAVDGNYGPKTERAIRSFQRTSHITVDGIVGPETWRALVAQ